MEIDQNNFASSAHGRAHFDDMASGKGIGDKKWDQYANYMDSLFDLDDSDKQSIFKCPLKSSKIQVADPVQKSKNRNFVNFYAKIY